MRLVDVEGERFHEDPFTGMVLFVCGVGNNGADGLVAARHLMEQRIPVTIALVGNVSHGSELFNKQLTMVRAMGFDIVSFESFSDWSRVHVVVEGLMGTGFQGELRESITSVLHDIDVERNQYGFPYGLSMCQLVLMPLLAHWDRVFLQLLDLLRQSVSWLLSIIVRLSNFRPLHLCHLW